MTEKTTFSQTLRKLRENKKISQKTVARDLGISQALLSHYEKGVRECGLNFLIKAAKYYGVTSDYLLDSASSVDKAENTDGNIELECACAYTAENEREKNKRIKKENGNNYSILYKNLLINVINYIFDGVKGDEYKRTAKIAGEYMILSAYSLYKYLFAASDMLNVKKDELAQPEELAAAQAKLIVGMKKDEQCIKEPPNMRPSASEYINHMIKNAENIISKY